MSLRGLCVSNPYFTAQGKREETSPSFSQIKGKTKVPRFSHNPTDNNIVLWYGILLKHRHRGTVAATRGHSGKEAEWGKAISTPNVASKLLSSQQPKFNFLEFQWSAQQ